MAEMDWKKTSNRKQKKEGGDQTLLKHGEIFTEFLDKVQMDDYLRQGVAQLVE